MKIYPYFLKPFFLMGVLLVNLSLVKAQTPNETIELEKERLEFERKKMNAEALAEIETLKAEIKAINRQIQQGMPRIQADSLKRIRTVARLKAYKEKVARLELEEKQNDGEESIEDYQYTFRTSPAVKIIVKEEYMISLGLVVSFGFNTMLTEGQSLQDNPYKIFGSRFFELGWTWAKPLQQENAKIHLKYGVSLMVNGYKLIENQYLEKQNDIVTIEKFPHPLSKSKLTISQLVFPVHLHFGRIERVAEKIGEGLPIKLKVYRRTPFQSMRFGIGGYAGINVRNVHKLKYREEGRRKKTKHKDHLNVNQFIVGLSGYVSLGPDFYLYSKYELTPIFRNQNLGSTSKPSPVLPNQNLRSNHFALGLRMNLD